jgi:aspartyl-tRNA(Asn)/glutamyl-tRNA(Gln) amidotransferase subunit A
LALLDLNYADIRKKLFSGEVHCQDIVQDYLQQIQQNVHLNTFLTIFDSKAAAKAIEVDHKIKNGNAGKLAGCVLGIKDLITIAGERTTCASHILSNFISPYSATVIKKLEREDAIFIGKTNMDEFAMGSSNENSSFGPVKNPHHIEYVPGGSSGGSAAAVAAKLCLAALGSDTGGSIRQPASFCGVVGIKPTYGRVSRFGLVAFASSLDQIGTITQSVGDAALLLEVISGFDPLDSTSADVAVQPFSDYVGKDIRDMRIGLPKEYFSEGLNVQVRESIQRVIETLKKAGAIITEVSLPHTEYAVATYYIIAMAEASSNLARYDGARYGLRSETAFDLEQMYVNSRTAGFGAEVKRRIMLGTYILSAGYYDAYYRKAQKVRTLIKQDFQQVFEHVDCLITPTAPTTAFRIGEKTSDPLEMYLSDIYTVSVNLAGLPGLAVPIAKDSQGLPVGLQLIGRPFEEHRLIQAADFIEKTSDFKNN